MDADAQGMAARALASIAAVAIDVSTHSTTLSADESGRDAIVFTGALSASTTFVLSGTARAQAIQNATTGAFDLSVKRGSSGVALVIPPGETVEVR